MRRVRTRDFTITITWISLDNTGAFMQEGLFKKDFTPLRVIQKSKLVSQPKGSFIGATPRADVLLLFPTDLYVKCHSDFSSKKTFFSLLFLRIYWNTIIWLTKWRAMEKKITTILLINFLIVFEKVSFVAFCLSLCFHNILYFNVNHYLQYFFQDNARFQLVNIFKGCYMSHDLL